MRSFASSAVLALAMANGAAAAVQKFVGTINAWTDPATQTRPPASATMTWSYWPNSFGTNCPALPAVCCGDGVLEPCGPLNWNRFPGNRCADGQQTPINFDVNEANYVPRTKSEGKLIFEGHACKPDVVKKDATWEMEFLDVCSEESKVTDPNGKVWKLWQIHVHGVSEHAVDGAYYPIEVHLVHIPENEQVDPANLSGALVLGVFLTAGKANKIFKVLTQEPATKAGYHLHKAIDPYDLLPANKAYWNYFGSLTTPPCKFAQAGFGVNWYVFKNPVQVSVAQLAWVTSYLCTLSKAFLCQVNRPLQPLLGTTQIKTFGKSLN